MERVLKKSAFCVSTYYYCFGPIGSVAVVTRFSVARSRAKTGLTLHA